ncbi:DUF4334 domain-containing protein [Streptomyces sp. DSM 44915]|uniref:DUF4334 domain-containing protein n=1 Tax=Streptomyces chisholmiae TaxID=3075540 RepID=A0ABU2JQD0_9ACTN|nr:DUF4334 domain-containing protein [Streptomyces sp. DSM 44915]MDT0267195.1 DUF4334 domain-containing protein [Streptomyces sp. DSM 44915]
MTPEQARTRFHELRAERSKVAPRELDAIWAALPTVRAAELLGAWRGAGFATGHRLNEVLREHRWHGKRFHSLDRVQPLICRDADGALFSHVELGKGEASLWDVEFRGEVTATMVYDGQAIFDHFKPVDDRTLMGIMNGGSELVRDQGEHFYFLLERDTPPERDEQR